MKNMLRSSLVALTALASVAGAQALPPIHPLGPVLATSAEPMASVSQVRALPGGRVLVHDNAGRRVLLYDSTFKKFSVIADTTGATGNAYGSRFGGLISARGDTTLFVDPQSISMLVIDGNGKIVRTMAAPQPNQVNALIGGPNGTPGVDPQGRLVFRAQIQPVFAQGRGAPGGVAGFVMPQLPESSLVMRIDLKSRKVDTVASFRIPKIMMNITRDENTGSMTMMSTVNPMPWTDDWALLSDGTVAIIRGQDYRVDLLGLDGKMTTGGKLAYEWQRLTDEDKTKIIDSTKTAMEKQRAAQLAKMTAATGGDKAGAAGSGGGAESKAAGAAAAGAAAEGGARQRVQADGGGGGYSMTINTGGPGGGRGATNFTMPPLNFVSIDQMPDYRPVFRQGAARGDADGNLWIRTSQMVNGGTVYNVISNKGELKDRILIPPGRVVAGFGPGGVVYMGVVDGDITHVERARVTAPAAAVGNK